MMNDDLLTQLLGVFRDEAEESLERLRLLFEELEGGTDGGQVRECLRLVHNLKGASASVGLNEFAEIAHLFEHFFTLHAEASSVPDEDQLNCLSDGLTSLDQLAQRQQSRWNVAYFREQLGVARETLSPETSILEQDVTTSPSEELPAIINEEQPRLPASTTSDNASAADETGRSETRMVRVDRARLDELLRTSNELLGLKATLLHRRKQFSEIGEELADLSRGLDAQELSRWAALQDRLNELVQADGRDGVQIVNAAQAFQDSMRKLRMIKIESAIPFWRRTLEEAARRLGKEARLVTEVGDLEIDKQILDRLSFPIVHLLRNAVAHGLEDASLRFEKGKPKRGQVTICAALRGSTVELSVEDDGAGIDVDRVAAIGVQRGLLEKKDAVNISFDKAVKLLFRPGFSTTERADLVSGRGVGLDEVEVALEELGGSVSICKTDSFTGGTLFRLSFPVSTLSTRGLLVRVGGGIYALPLQMVQRTLRLPRHEVSRLNGASVFRLEDGEIIRLRELSSLLKVSQAPQAEFTNVVILKSGQERWALSVEEVLWDSELMLKPLPWNLQHLPLVSGLAPLNTGDLAIVLDPQQLVEKSTHSTRVEAGPETERTPILVVDDSLTRRTLHLNLLRSAGYEVESAVDGVEAWEMMQKSTFCVLVSDVQMPRMDGVELTRKVREDGSLRTIPIVLVTGLTGSEDEDIGIAAGANAYLRKADFERDTLLKVVASLLEEEG